MKRRARRAPSPAALDALVRRALREDIGRGDITTRVCLPPGLRARARVRTRRSCVVCGLDLLRRVFRSLDARVRVSLRMRDGDWARGGATLAVAEGPAASLLAGERVALNFLQHLSGIATRARRCTQALSGSRTLLLDTRKTHPGLRDLERYAVRCGGATNHRRGLDDAVLIKDNHVALAGGVDAALRRARHRLPGVPLMIEVDTLRQLEEAVAAGARIVLLDNFTLRRVRQARRRFGRRVLLEASGGVHEGNLRALARTGVPRISMGALTHSVPWADIGLDIERTTAPRAGR